MSKKTNAAKQKMKTGTRKPRKRSKHLRRNPLAKVIDTRPSFAETISDTVFVFHMAGAILRYLELQYGPCELVIQADPAGWYGKQVPLSGTDPIDSQDEKTEN